MDEQARDQALRRDVAATSRRLRRPGGLRRLFGSLEGPSLAPSAVPVLGHFAESDPYESDEAVATFERALRAAGRDVQIHRYPGTGHWFAEPSRDAYQAAAADLAFQRTVAFFRRHVTDDPGAAKPPDARHRGRKTSGTLGLREEGRMRVTVSPDQIRTAFEAVKDDPSFDESRGLWERGQPPVEMIQAMCLRPEILRAFAGFGASVYPGGLLERRVKELVIITASRSNDCQFCTESHCDLVDLAGIVENPLAVIDDPTDLGVRERLAIAYTKAAMADSNSVPEGLSRQLKEQFSDPELVELTFLIGYINMLNLFNNLLGVRYNGEYSLLRTAAT